MQSCATLNFQLADHVRACHIDGQVILLDLKRNKYVGIGGKQVSAISREIEGWPAVTQELSSATAPCSPTAPVASLLRQNMLTAASNSTREPTQLDASTESLLPDGSEELLAQARNLPALAWASFITARLLKRKSLHDIREKVIRMRQGHRAHRTDQPADLLRQAVNSYMRLRPFVFTAHDQCLHDSLTLVHFLARRGLFPRWVIGVRTGPFAAHSWVQSGPVVLNDLHENVAAYTPIMVV